MSGTCAGCARSLVTDSRFCVHCGRPADATGSGTAGDTNVRLPRVTVPLADAPLPAHASGSGAAARPAVTAPPAWDVPSYGSGPRFPLYADEAPTYAAAGSLPATPAAPGAGDRSRRRPPAALVAAVALVLLVAVVGGALLRGGGDGSPAAEAERGADGGGAADGGAADAPQGEDLAEHEPEAEVTDPVDLATAATPAASATGAPGVDLAGREVTYDVANVVDGDPATAWRVEGDGTGETLTLTFPQEVAVTELGLVNGYAKVDEHDGEQVDWYERNRVVTSVRWTLDDGEVLEQDLVRDPTPQTIEVPATLTRTVEVEILAVSGHNGADRTPISEVVVQGAPAADVAP